MKRILSVFLAVVMLTFAAACAPKIPEGMSKGAYDLGLQALDAADEYLDGNVSANDARNDVYIISQELLEWVREAEINKELQSYVFFVSLDFDGLGLLYDREDILESRR